LKNEPPFEVRDYGVLTVAETLIEGDFDIAGSQGFRRVAGYIFGKNQNARGESEKIAMTAPVTMEAQNQKWRMHFVMPQGMTLAHLSKPLDASVQLREVPAQRMAVVRFSGLTTASRIEHHTQLLKDWLGRNNLAYEDRPQLARYNDPFTLPWNRRNEILIPLKGM
jgi:DNA gyrase inhibitor GyrI